jgi:glycosyltransferase involved in cell wall biosynthesis
VSPAAVPLPPDDRMPTIGLLPWGNVLEDFLEPSGLTLDTFRQQFTGSWIFGWTRALATASVRTEVVCVSRAARAVVRATHGPTGTPLLIVPAPRAYRMVERRMAYPYGDSVAQVFGDADRGAVKRMALDVGRELAPYVALPGMRLVRLARQAAWQAVLCQEYEDPRFDVSVLLGRALRVPVFACFQGGTTRTGRIERIVRPRAMARAAGLIVGPEREAQRLTERCGVARERITRIGNPVDLAVWRPHDRAAARARLGIDDSALVVAWHGRVAIEHKGLDILLDAWRRMIDARPADLRLLLVGDGQDSEEVDRLIAAGPIPGVVRVARYVHDPQELSRHLSAADVYAFASRHEGFPVAPIEAMACGLPVVSTDVAGVRDILAGGEAGGGLIVPARDPEALAGALLRLLGDEALRRRLGARARARATAEFSLEAIGTRLRELMLGDGANGPVSHPLGD